MRMLKIIAKSQVVFENRLMTTGCMIAKNMASIANAENNEYKKICLYVYESTTMLTICTPEIQG